MILFNFTHLVEKVFYVRVKHAWKKTKEFNASRKRKRDFLLINFSSVHHALAENILN